jgi:hypothetical protein
MLMRDQVRLVGALAVIVLLFAPAAMATTGDTASLDHGFQLMYDLDFIQAQREFGNWQQLHPEDPVGPVAEAAGLLFSELNRLGVLEAQFFENDAAFHSRKKLSPDPAVRSRFDAALKRASDEARQRLQANSKDADALFALTLCAGLNADYAALIEKRNMASLHYSREATSWAEQLLAVAPSYYDAYVATGAHKYIIGSLPAPVRWALRVGGVSGSKEAGIADLQQTAEHGRYLAPFARILLAIAYLRQHDREKARATLDSLHQDFPKNTLFVQEIARLEQAR